MAALVLGTVRAKAPLKNEQIMEMPLRRAVYGIAQHAPGGARYWEGVIVVTTDARLLFYHPSPSAEPPAHIDPEREVITIHGEVILERAVFFRRDIRRAPLIRWIHQTKSLVAMFRPMDDTFFSGLEKSKPLRDYTLELLKLYEEEDRNPAEVPLFQEQWRCDQEEPGDIPLFQEQDPE